MELKKKEMTSATYNVVAEDGDFTLTGKVTLAGGEVKSIVGCKVEKGGVVVALFGLYGNSSTQVTYNTDHYDERVEVLGKIDAFVEAVTGINE